MFNDSIEFAMEECEHLAKISDSDYQCLLRNLKTLHKYHIVHMDIKPDNIMYSPAFKKPVFIDYGFSEIIEQSIGFKTMTCFKGTLEFVSPQMRKIFSLDELTT
jgi:serine/threonine protein kinase